MRVRACCCHVIDFGSICRTFGSASLVGIMLAVTRDPDLVMQGTTDFRCMDPSKAPLAGGFGILSVAVLYYMRRFWKGFGCVITSLKSLSYF